MISPSHSRFHPLTQSAHAAQSVPCLGVTLPITIGGSDSVNALLDSGSAYFAVFESGCQITSDTTCPPPLWTLPSGLRPLACSATWCHDDSATRVTASCTAAHACQVQAKYGDNSGWTGNLYVDSVTISPSDASAEVAIFAISSATTNIGPILGVSYGGVNETFLTAFSEERQLPNAFALTVDSSTSQPVNRVGTITLGGSFAPASGVTPPSPLQLPVSPTASGEYLFHRVPLTGIALGSTKVAVSTSSLAIVDSGTTLLVLPASIASAVAASIPLYGTKQT